MELGQECLYHYLPGSASRQTDGKQELELSDILGPDPREPEALKSNREMSAGLLLLFQNMWNKEECPKDWKENLVNVPNTET